MAEKRTIGRIERICLGEFGITDMQCRVDTGARTSALHVDRLLEVSDGFVVFELVHAHETIRIRARVARRSIVRTTSDTREARIVVNTLLRIGDIEHPIDIGLCRRDRMRHPMILGRSAIAGYFVVDPGKVYTDARRRVVREDTERFALLGRDR